MNRFTRSVAGTLANSTVILATALLATPHADAAGVADGRYTGSAGIADARRGPRLAASNCVTKAEFKKVKAGITRKKAQSIMGATPMESFTHPDYPGAKFFNYDECEKEGYLPGYVQLRVKKGVVKGKAAAWGPELPPQPPCPPLGCGDDGGDEPPPPGTGDGGGEEPPTPPGEPGDGGGQLPW